MQLYTTRRIRDSVCTQTRVEKLVALRLPPVAKAASTSTSSPVSEQQVVLTHPTSGPSPKIKAGHSRATRGGEFLSEGGTSSMPNRAAGSSQTNIAAMFQPRQARSNPRAGAHPAQRAPTPTPPRSARQTGSFRQVTARSSRAAQLPASAPARRTAPPPPSTGAAPPPRVSQATEPTVHPTPAPTAAPTGPAGCHHDPLATPSPGHHQFATAGYTAVREAANCGRPDRMTPAARTDSSRNGDVYSVSADGRPRSKHAAAAGRYGRPLRPAAEADR